jgi:methylmalonyl-CoA mutase
MTLDQIQMSTTNLFSDFNKVSAKEWKQKIQMDLKGADYNKTLLTNTLEGITIQPFYHQETFKSLAIPKQKNKTKICQTIFINDEKIVNNIAKEVLQKGAESIRFIANEPFKIKQVFKDLPKEIDYLIICDFYEEKFIQKLISISKDINLHIVIDSIHHFVSDGNWFNSQDIDFDILHNNPTITIGINASLYQNAGANIVQQIAYSLAHVNEYLNLVNNKTKDFIFTFAIGSNYFFEISKIRAFKHLIKELLTEYNSDSNVKIILEPTLRNKTLYDYNVNLLRTTTESMAAMLSGADYITNVSYDSIYHRSNKFGSRIARNQLLVLKEESYFNKENDLSKGSYYIEQITFEIADKALALFKDIENNGGFLVQLEKGTIQRKIEESAKKEQTLFDNGELILLGTNKYPNPNDKMKDELELYPFIKTKPRKIKIKPIISRRLSEKLEQERLKEEKL